MTAEEAGTARTPRADPRAAPDADARVPDLDVPREARVGFRVRFDEAGTDDLARASTLLRYAAETAWVHAEAVGLGRDWGRDRDLSWVVRCVELAVSGRARSGASLEATTRVTGFRRVWAGRRTTIRAADGSSVAIVDTDWVMTDLRRGLPVRVPDEFPRAFALAPGPYEPRRVTLPPTPATAARLVFAVRRHELDPLAHANHAVYVDWLEEAALALPGGAGALLTVPRTYRMEYAGAARSGAVLTGSAWPLDAPAGIAYRLEDDGAELVRGLLLPRVGPHPDGEAASAPGDTASAPGDTSD